MVTTALSAMAMGGAILVRDYCVPAAMRLPASRDSICPTDIHMVMCCRVWCR